MREITKSFRIVSILFYEINLSLKYQDARYPCTAVAVEFMDLLVNLGEL